MIKYKKLAKTTCRQVTMQHSKREDSILSSWYSSHQNLSRPPSLDGDQQQPVITLPVYGLLYDLCTSKLLFRGLLGGIRQVRMQCYKRDDSILSSWYSSHQNLSRLSSLCDQLQTVFTLLFYGLLYDF